MAPSNQAVSGRWVGSRAAVGGCRVAMRGVAWCCGAYLGYVGLPVAACRGVAELIRPPLAVPINLEPAVDILVRQEAPLTRGILNPERRKPTHGPLVSAAESDGTSQGQGWPLTPAPAEKGPLFVWRHASYYDWVKTLVDTFGRGWLASWLPWGFAASIIRRTVMRKTQKVDKLVRHCHGRTHVSARTHAPICPGRGKAPPN